MKNTILEDMVTKIKAVESLWFTNQIITIITVFMELICHLSLASSIINEDTFSATLPHPCRLTYLWGAHCHSCSSWGLLPEGHPQFWSRSQVPWWHAWVALRAWRRRYQELPYIFWRWRAMRWWDFSEDSAELLLKKQDHSWILQTMAWYLSGRRIPLERS